MRVPIFPLPPVCTVTIYIAMCCKVLEIALWHRSVNCISKSGLCYGYGLSYVFPRKEDNGAEVVLAERRNYHRSEANLFTVFRRLCAKGAFLPQVGFTKDVSAGGAYFFTRSEVAKGDSISVAIHVTSDWAAGGNPPRLEADGRVLRVERGRGTSASNDTKGVAVKFKQELAVSF